MTTWIRTAAGELVNLNLVHTITLLERVSRPIANGRVTEAWEYRPVAEFDAYTDDQISLVDEWLDRETAACFLQRLFAELNAHVRCIDAAAVLRLATDAG
jgi:hypothetical protein